MKKLEQKLSQNIVFMSLFIIILLLLGSINSKSEKLNKEKNKKQYLKDFPLHNYRNIYSSEDNSEFFSNNRIDENIEKEKIEDFSSSNIEIKNEYSITSMNHIFSLDSKKKSCDIEVTENVSFRLKKESNELDYIIISKKTPLYGFKVKSLNKYYGIKSIKILQDSSFKQRNFIDEEGKRLTFRDRWLLNIEFTQPLLEVQLEIKYKMQRAVLIDSNNEINYLKFSLINPHSETIDDYKLMIDIKNFSNLKPDDLIVPMDSLIESDNKDIKITTSKPFEKHTEYEVNLNLPYELTSCEGNIVDIIYYVLIGMSVVFVVMSVSTLMFLYKE